MGWSRQKKSKRDYYAAKLTADRLKRCYDLAPPPVQSYLSAEIDFVRQKIRRTERALELGCGYGRAMKHLAPRAAAMFGIDTSWDSLRLARRYLEGASNCYLFAMNAVELGFRLEMFDLVACIQNGISAFHVDQRKLIVAAVEVTKPGGLVLFSSYSERFWDERLHWFRVQAEHGLIGEIDEEGTGNGVIVCKDGFRATTVRPQEFAALTEGLGKRIQITEVADSSVFCEIRV